MWRGKMRRKARCGEMRCCDVRGCQARGRKPASATTKVDPAGPELPSTTRPGYRWGGRGTNDKSTRCEQRIAP